MERFLSRMDEETSCVFVMALWFLWYSRNQFYFQKRVITVVELVSLITVQRRDFLEAMQRVDRRTAEQRGDGIWKPPEQREVKLNCDATVRLGVGAAAGRVVRDDCGRVLWCFARRCPAGNDVAVAEAWAVRQGLLEAQNRDVQRIVVETDSLILVQALKKKMNSNLLSYFGRLVQDIFLIAESFASISFVWVRRSGNVVAHRLAYFGLTSETPFFSLVIPEIIADSVDADLRHSV